MEKNNKGIIFLLSVVIIILLGAVIYLFMNGNFIKETDSTGKNETVEKDSNKGNDDQKVEEFSITKFDTTKPAINCATGVTYKPFTENTNTTGLSISLNADKRSATIKIDWNLYSKIYGVEGTGSVVAYSVTNFTKEIKEVYILGYGQASGNETAFYLMEDGTVEFTPIKDSIRNNVSQELDKVFKSYGSLEGISDVEKIIEAEPVSWPNMDRDLGANGIYILGVKSDYSFYNLNKSIAQKTNNSNAWGANWC